MSATPFDTKVLTKMATISGAITDASNAAAVQAVLRGQAAGRGRVLCEGFAGSGGADRRGKLPDCPAGLGIRRDPPRGRMDRLAGVKLN